MTSHDEVRIQMRATRSYLTGELLEAAIDSILSTDINLSIREAYEWTSGIERTRPARFSDKTWMDTVAALKTVYHAPYIPSGVPNLLLVDEEDKTIPWENRYRARLAKIGAAYGKPVLDEPDYYSWVDSKYLSHFYTTDGGCRIAEVTSLVTEEWDEFVDTFADPGDGHYVGFSGDAKCACGYWEGKVRWEGDEAELIREVVKDSLFF